MTIDATTLHFSDFDMPENTFAAPTRHHVFVYKNLRSITANCNDCEWALESQGQDDSSRHAVGYAVKKHEAGA